MKRKIIGYTMFDLYDIFDVYGSFEVEFKVYKGNDIKGYKMLGYLKF